MAVVPIRDRSFKLKNLMDFSGGFAFPARTESDWERFENWEIGRDGLPVSRLGSVKYNTNSIDSNPIVGMSVKLLSFSGPATQTLIIAKASTTWYYTQNPSSFIPQSFTSMTVPNSPGNTVVNFEQTESSSDFSYAFVAVNAYFPGVLTWNGQGSPSIIASSPQRGQFICSSQSRLFIAGFPENPFSIRFSDTANPASWPTSSFFDVPGQRGAITGLARFNDQLIIFTQRSILSMQGDPGTGFQIQVLHDDIGCTQPNSIASFGNNIFFVFNSDLMAFNGGVTVLSEKLRGLPLGSTSATTAPFQPGRMRAALTPHYYFLRTNLHTDATTTGGLGPAFTGDSVVSSGPLGPLMLFSFNFNSNIVIYSFDQTSGSVSTVFNGDSQSTIFYATVYSDPLGRFVYVNRSSSGSSHRMEIWQTAPGNNVSLLSTDISTVDWFNMSFGPMLFDSTGRFALFMTGFGGSQGLHVLSIDQSSGALTDLGRTTFTNQPMYAIKHPTNNSIVYAFDSTSLAVTNATTFSLNTKTGALSTISTVSNTAQLTLRFGGAQFSADNKFLFATGGVGSVTSGIASFSIDPTTFALSLVGVYGSVAKGYQDAFSSVNENPLIHVSGNNLYVTNQADNLIRWFTINADGSLTQNKSLALQGRVFDAHLNNSGTVLYVITFVSGTQDNLYVINVNSDGSLGVQNTHPIISNTGVSEEHFSIAGDFLLVDSFSLMIWKIDPVTGDLTLVSSNTTITDQGTMIA